MRAINVLLAILVSAAIGLLVFEGGLRLIGKGPPDTLNAFDPHTGWGKKPNYRLERNKKEFQVTFETNSLGLRDDEVSRKKPAGTYRVIMLGDSFTLGYTVDRKDLFVDLLEARWNAEGRKVEVLNVGTEGWSTDQEAAWVLANGKDYDPDLIVLLPYDNDVFYCAQDNYGGLAKPQFDANGKLVSGTLPDATTGWRRNTAIGRLITPSPARPMFESSGKSVLGEFSILMNRAPDVLGDAPARAKGAVSALAAECKKIGAELVIAPIPSNASADADFAKEFGTKVLGAGSSAWSPDRAVDFYLSTAKDLGVRTADARSAMKAAHAEESCYFNLFGPDREWHFNATGNRAFANFLAASLDDLLPAKKTDAPADLLAGSSAPVEGGIPFFLKLYGTLWVLLTGLYFANYRDEPFFLPPLKVGLILAVVFATFMGVEAGVSWLSVYNPTLATGVLVVLILGVLGFVAYKLGSRLATIAELLKAFTLRGHWYLMPMVVVLLTIGSLLVVAASSPLVAPFIYTLF